LGLCVEHKKDTKDALY